VQNKSRLTVHWIKGYELGQSNYLFTSASEMGLLPVITSYLLPLCSREITLLAYARWNCITGGLHSSDFAQGLTARL
jgi:hypothetical protein